MLDTYNERLVIATASKGFQSWGVAESVLRIAETSDPDQEREWKSRAMDGSLYTGKACKSELNDEASSTKQPPKKQQKTLDELAIENNVEEQSQPRHIPARTQHSRSIVIVQDVLVVSCA